MAQKAFYSCFPSPIGDILIASSSRGLCRLALPRRRERFFQSLQRRFGVDGLVQQVDQNREAIKALEGYFQGMVKSFDLPLDLQGTDFQIKVWEALMRIPYGQTRSYGEVAAVIGNPRASRAVASANASNPVPIIIPCHRVIRGDGSLGGYGGGIELKRILLEGEGTGRMPSVFSDLVPIKVKEA